MFCVFVFYSVFIAIPLLFRGIIIDGALGLTKGVGWVNNLLLFGTYLLILDATGILARLLPLLGLPNA